jgi:glycosyltransferase involved in cell wall biosynthesis
MRLLMTADVVGGVWQYATGLAEALTPFGIETMLAVMGPSPSAERLEAARAIPGVSVIDTGIGLDWLSKDIAAVRASGRMMAELAGDSGADVVQLNMPALGAGARFAMPVVAMAHSCVATWWDAMHGNAPPPDFAWRGALVGEGLRNADHVVAPTAAFADATMRVHCLEVRPTVVHNGRTLPNLPSAAMHDFAFTAGRLWDKGKNIATIDRAAARLGIPIKAAGALSGPNGERAELTHIHATGALDEDGIARCLSARPVFVSAARYEPFGLSVLEAAAAGCALVLSDIPSFRELWDGVAIFVQPEDDHGFAAAIDAIVGDGQLRVQMGEAASERAAHFTPAAMAIRMAALYADTRRSGGRTAVSPRVAA